MDFAHQRAKIEKILYTRIARPIFFLFDPEFVHNAFVERGRFLGSNTITKALVSQAFNYQNPDLEQNILGLKFRNPVGLAAGFDKNGETISIMEDVGFGFIEVGSVTAKSSPGNEGKRLGRLKEQKALWVNLGLNSHGAARILKRIGQKNLKIPLGISAARTNSRDTVSNEAGIQDYLLTIKTFQKKADFFVLNVSCPNSFGGLDFSNPPLFENLAKGIKKLNVKQPIFVKLSPDLSKSNIDKIVSISSKYGISGFICTNLTKKHALPKGGLSGKLLEHRSNELLSYVYQKSKKIGKGKKFILIGTGGIFSAEDAYKKIKLGANLVQLITGMIYQGPQLIGEINHDLVGLLKKDGFKHISEAVGTAKKM